MEFLPPKVGFFMLQQDAATSSEGMSLSRRLTTCKYCLYVVHI